MACFYRTAVGGEEETQSGPSAKNALPTPIWLPRVPWCLQRKRCWDPLRMRLRWRRLSPSGFLGVLHIHEERGQACVSAYFPSGTQLSSGVCRPSSVIWPRTTRSPFFRVGGRSRWPRSPWD
jgi:hypothetical protein